MLKADDPSKSPRWPQVLVGIVTYAVLLLLFAPLMGLLPMNDPVSSRIVGSTFGDAMTWSPPQEVNVTQ